MLRLPSSALKKLIDTMGFFFMPKGLCHKDLAHLEYIIYIRMCPTLLGRAHDRNGIFGEFGIEFDNGFDKPIWEKMPACGYSRPQEVFMRQFYLGKTSSGYSQKFGLERTAL